MLHLGPEIGFGVNFFGKSHYHNSPNRRPLYYTLPTCDTRMAGGPRTFCGRSVEVSVQCSFPGQCVVNFIITVITKPIFFSSDTIKYAIFKSQNVIFIVLIMMFFTKLLHNFQLSLVQMLKIIVRIKTENNTLFSDKQYVCSTLKFWNIVTCISDWIGWLDLLHLIHLHISGL
jgi:hypothetical protein